MKTKKKYKWNKKKFFNNIITLIEFMAVSGMFTMLLLKILIKMGVVVL